MENNNEEEIIDIKIIYKDNKDGKDKLRLFGEDFISKNKDNCKIIYGEKEYDIKEYFEDIIGIDYEHKNEIVLILRINNKVIDLSFMFAECDKLLSIPEVSILDNSKIKNFINSKFENNSFSSFSNQSEKDYFDRKYLSK